MNVIPVAIVAGVVAGVLTVGLATPSTPRPAIEKQSWAITEADGKTISPQRPLELPRRYADFDLHCRLELPANADVDLLFRKVEHWGEGHLPLFHARFAAIRVSTRKTGPGLLTREELLFGPDVGGIRVDPGSPASLELECRGNRIVRANVNGVDLPNIETTDDFGNLALVSRDGVAIVHDFKVTVWPEATDYMPWIVGASAGAGLGLLLGILGASVLAMIASMLTFGFGGWVATALVFTELMPAVAPSATGVSWGALCLLPAALVVGCKFLKPGLRLVLTVLLGVALGAVILEMAARSERDKFTVFEDERLNLVFGPQSGGTPFHAVSRMLKCTYTVHTLTPERYDILLLGGKRFFDQNEAEGGKNVDTALPVLVRAKLKLPRGKESTCAAIPTDLPNAYQQFAMFRNYYKDFRPRVVVLGLSGDEDDAHLISGMPPRALAEFAEAPRERSAFTLLDVYRGRDGARQKQTRPTSADELRATLEDLHSLCSSTGSRLVLAIDKSLSAEFQKVAMAFAGNRKIPAVLGFAIDEGHYPIEPLAEVVVSELIR